MEKPRRRRLGDQGRSHQRCRVACAVLEASGNVCKCVMNLTTVVEALCKDFSFGVAALSRRVLFMYDLILYVYVCNQKYSIN